MKKSIIAIAFMVAIAIPSIVSAQPLWGDTKRGMTEQEVASTVDGAYPISGGGSLATGAVEKLRKDEINIAGEVFTQSFYFKDGGLTQVTISLAGSHKFNSALRIYNRVSTALRSKYGQEVNVESTSGSFMRSENAEWAVGPTNISLLVMSIGDEDALLNINYQTRLSEDASQL